MRLRLCEVKNHAHASYVKDVENMAEFLVQQLKLLGAFFVEKRPIGTHKLDGKEVDLPPVVIAQVGQDPKKVRLRSIQLHRANLIPVATMTVTVTAQFSSTAIPRLHLLSTVFAC